jgi:ubiquinone/menaquinone biosynthesis C-methylase UbiE
VTSPERRGSRALARQLERYYVRFTGGFWAFFEAEVMPRLPDAPTLVDVGCGPGLYLRDVRKLLPSARLHGIDVAQEMIDNARALEFDGEPPTLTLSDAKAAPLPFADGSVELLTVAAVLHTFDDPWAFLAEARRVLAPEGLLLVYDWIRVPMREYMVSRQTEPGDPPELRYSRALELFATHNKYTEDDWRWVLTEGGFVVLHTAAPLARARAFLLGTG